MTKRNFWADFLIAAAVCFVNLIIFRVLFLLASVVPVGIILVIIGAILAVEAVVSQKEQAERLCFL